MTKYHLKRKKIFIAGHGGMVGSSLVNFFKNKGFNNLILVSKKKLNLLAVVPRIYDPMAFNMVICTRRVLLR